MAKRATCKFCKVGGLSWDQIHYQNTQQWRLMDANTKTAHHCQKPQQGEQSPQPFESPIPAPQQETPKAEPKVIEVNTENDKLKVLKELFSSGLTADQVKTIVESHLAKFDPKDRIEALLKEARIPREIIVQPTVGQPENIGKQHESFPELLSFVAQRESVYLVGPAGSGKTSAARLAAQSVNLPFYCISLGPQSTEAKLLGYNDANGNLVKSLAYVPYKNGGVLLLDEIDAASPSVLTGMNAMLSNGHASFGNEIVEKHENFVCIAAGNTFGNGATRQYVGRAQLDAATLDRFANMEWNYDEVFERELAGNDDWTKYVQKVRRAIDTLNLRYIVSPRASIKGAKMLKSGMPRDRVESAYIWKEMTKDDKTKVLGAI